ncbi:DNA phosphorothioation-dependent restriction protein DptG [Pseudoalteromonas agarivorans]|uniref:DNA phosphorothioation-dependent restriction protein DptG n=1 Tax=Pseudoalteromonas agarivorans TaxID=176102 RepID=UPI00211835EB|nr:DNA phosphorothioation-dependent restriction protein DptG [Pseudoalteromonas agarivorans]MCQ8820301.1 DNA phosphorothioation-dependent restriction protein DptG [Pseudoalteromonas agarivorans]
MIKETLTPPNNNAFNTFLPLRTKDKHYKFCWDTVLGYFVHVLYAKSLVNGDIEHFKGLCEKRFSTKLDEPEFWTVLEKMYFENEQLFKISPELLIFKALKDEVDTNSKKLGDMFVGLLNGLTLDSSSVNDLNFLEKEIKAEFDSFYVSGKSKTALKTEPAYLPFLSELFKQDLQFLNKRPHYLLNNFNSVIRLYGFLYISQMALNIKNWANGAPSSKPCFFIIDNEKASDERSQVKNFGYSQLHEYLEYLFPYLFMNEAIQTKGEVKPLWQLFESINENDVTKLNQFGRDFVDDRMQRKWYNTEQNWLDSSDKKEVLQQLLSFSHAQFDNKKGRLTEYNDTVVKGTLSNILDPFIQRRGRAGQVLTFNQDYIVLLTNLAIGERDKLRFHEIIKEFEARGVFFDKQSQQSLIDFYERMGNVERMSDSGDAVYVRKTV